MLHEKEKSRTIEYLIVNGIMLLIMLTVSTKENIYIGVLYFAMFFLINFKLILPAEKRKTMQSMDIKKINGDLIESLLYIVGIIVFFVFVAVKKISYDQWHPYFCFAVFGLVNGAFLGELLWRRFYLSKLSDIEIQRYWGNTRNSIILPSIFSD
ncbi:MAG: hypothetical protein V1833_00280 [Elusimicrobiota bacterium]